MAYRDPNAPVVARLFATNTPPNERIEIDSYRNEGPTTGSQIRFYRGNEIQERAAKLLLQTLGLDPEFQSVYSLIGSDYDGNGERAGIFLYDMTDGTGEVVLQGTRVWLGDNALVTSPVKMWDALSLAPETWQGITLAGTWIDLAGSRADFYKDATGRVQLRGTVIGGGANLIGTLPAGYWPTQTMEWNMRGQGGVIMCGIQVSAVNGQITAVANPGTIMANGARLDSISFPTE